MTINAPAYCLITFHVVYCTVSENDQAREGVRPKWAMDEPYCADWTQHGQDDLIQIKSQVASILHNILIQGDLDNGDVHKKYCNVAASWCVRWD